MNSDILLNQLKQLKAKTLSFFNKTPRIINILAGIVTILTFVILIFPKKSSSIDLSGYWDMTFKIENSDWPPYKNGNLEYKYKITFCQKDIHIEGTGEKFWEKFNGNERFYNSKEKTPVTIKGKIENNTFSATIYEKGIKRESSGYIRFEIKDKNTNMIKGVFNVTAANSTGIVLLKKENNK